MKISVSATSVKDLWHEGLAMALFSDEKPPRGVAGMVDWRLGGMISRSIARGTIAGSYGETILFHPDSPFLGPWKILMVGLGEREQLTTDRIYGAGWSIMNTMHRIGCRDFTSSVPGTGRCELPPASMVEAYLSGMLDALSETGESPDGQTSIHLVEAPGHISLVAAALHDRAARTGNLEAVDAPAEGTGNPEPQDRHRQRKTGNEGNRYRSR